jgi:hypothetical protein
MIERWLKLYYIFTMKKKGGESQGYYGFDSSGLEKAAVAAKYLDASPNAKEAFDLAVKKESTK